MKLYFSAFSPLASVKKSRFLEIMGVPMLLGTNPPAAVYSSTCSISDTFRQRSNLKCFVTACMKILPVSLMNGCILMIQLSCGDMFSFSGSATTAHHFSSSADRESRLAEHGAKCSAKLFHKVFFPFNFSCLFFFSFLKMPKKFIHPFPAQVYSSLIMTAEETD